MGHDESFREPMRNEPTCVAKRLRPYERLKKAFGKPIKPFTASRQLNEESERHGFSHDASQVVDVLGLERRR